LITTTIGEKMEQKKQNPKAEDETQIVSRRIQRISLHITPIPRPLHDHDSNLGLLPCARREKLEVETEKLSVYMRGKYRDIQEKIYEYFNARPELQTPVEISKDEHRELCWRQMYGLIREAGIRPLKYVVEEPAKYFAIVEAVGAVDISLGIKLGVQYR
jgi:acyl-CoA oxidase